jgi:hypothetical protein
VKWEKCTGRDASSRPCVLHKAHMIRFPHSSSNLVAHAQRELMILGEDSETTYNIMLVVQAYASMGHSGGSHSVILPRLVKLLSYENLTDITDDPEEWVHHGPELWGGKKGVWQNIRNSAALSEDGGVTYHLVESKDWNQIHFSKPSGKNEIKTKGGDENGREPGGKPGASPADGERDA